MESWDRPRRSIQLRALEPATKVGVTALRQRLPEVPNGFDQAVSKVSSAEGIDARLLRQANAVGREAHALMERLYPLCRSLTGDGVRKTLQLLQDIIPLKIHDVPTG